MTAHEQFVLIWKGTDSKPATCIRYINDVFQSYISNLGSGFLFNLSILPLADEKLKLHMFIKSVEILILSCINWFNTLQLLILAVECTSYSSLTSGDRKTTYITQFHQCDSNLDGWYRFQGAAGTRMPTSCPPEHRCNTYATGWLNGGHPTVADGKVTRQVCFHYFSKCCWQSTNIEVRNCGSFYVYRFSGTPHCELRYCGTD